MTATLDTFPPPDDTAGLRLPGDPLDGLGDPAAASIALLRVAHERHVAAVRDEMEARCALQHATVAEDCDEAERHWWMARCDALEARSLILAGWLDSAYGALAGLSERQVEDAMQP